MNSCWISQNHEGIAGGFFAVFAETGVSHAPFQCHCHLGGAQSINGETRDRETRVVFFSLFVVCIISAFHGGSHFLPPYMHMGVEMVATRGERSYTVVDVPNLFVLSMLRGNA